MTEKQRNMAIGAITFMVGNGYFVDAPETEDALNETIKTLAEMDEQTERDWVPCEEVEPEEDQECWFTVNDRGFRYVNRGCFTRRYGERRDKGFITAGGFAWWNTAIAWMPIPEPEPYKGETE